MDILLTIWIVIQVLIGYNLIFPILLYGLYQLPSHKKNKRTGQTEELYDYAFIVTAYQFTDTLNAVVDSILRINYPRYTIYVVADNCDISTLNFRDERIVLLRPPEVLASNTRSHAYAITHFQGTHDVITIIDSDNIVDLRYIDELNKSFNAGFDAVQGLRAAKNIEGTIASLDAARDIYYHFYDGKLLFECGSSATLAGSGMAFKSQLYKRFLDEHSVSGAGFDKVLQAWLINEGMRIAFNERAIVLDEKTSRPDQLIKQRSRWINTWFKYSGLGFGILLRGIKQVSINQILFGIILLRPPLFIFLIASALCLLADLITGNFLAAGIWCISVLLFVISFFIALIHAGASKHIYRSLLNIPKFMALQMISLVKAKDANKISVSTQHYYNEKQSDSESQ
jgi:cellulose synthase/poly-beta-1,6-N-acetylglucosamine synthase-like glycosyltransferase